MNNALLSFTLTELVEDVNRPVRYVVEVLDYNNIQPAYFEGDEPLYIFDKLSYIAFRLALLNFALKKMAQQYYLQGLN